MDEIVDACMNICPACTMDTFVTDIFSTVRHSWESPQGDEHQRGFLEVLE